jgi:hypothetical protein
MGPDEARRRYMAARAQAITRTADPQQARRNMEARGQALAPRVDLPCECTGTDPLAHTGWEHHLTAASRKYPAGRRLQCSIVTPAGACPCQEYRPRTV